MLLQIPLNTAVWRVKTYRKWVNEEPAVEPIAEEILSLGNMWKEIENEMNQLIENINLQVSNLFGETLQKISETESRVNSLNTHISQILSQQDTLKSNNQKIYTRLAAISDVYIMEKDRIKSSFSILEKYDLQNIQGKEPLLGEDKLFFDTVKNCQ